MIPVLAEHHCGRRHATAATFLRCRHPDVAAITGKGRIALVIRCGAPRALLFERLEGARTLTAEYDVFGCGPRCARNHELAAIDLDGGPDLPARPITGQEHA